MTVPVFLFAGGGSGGHIAPALAVAERLVEMEPAAEAHFLCSDRPVDHTMLADAGVGFNPLPGAPFSLRPRGLARFARGFARSRRAARQLIEAKHVGRVVAMGGFVAAPVVAAAAGAGTAVTLLNLDDPPGKANRWIARRSDDVLSAIALSQHRVFPHRVVGMPVRRSAVSRQAPEACRRAMGLDPDRPTLLVTGASQGARSVNDLMAAMAAGRPEVFDGWQVLHLTGPGDERRLGAAYDAAGVKAVVEPFLHCMGDAWGAADLALSRAGASSVAEAWVNGVPTVFLPYPYHRDDHQRRNAQPMVRAGGAVVEPDRVDAEANTRAAGATVAELMRNDRRRNEMSDALRRHPAPDGAAAVASRLLESAIGDR